MATDVIKKIGATNTPTTMDYSSIAAFEADLPASLVAVDERWIGEVYNQGELTASSAIVFTAITTDATRNVILRTATGASFRDNANVRTNALDYSSSNGAAHRQTSNYVSLLQCNIPYTVIQDMQFKNDNSGNNAINLDLQANNIIVKNCIIRVVRGLVIDALSAGSFQGCFYYNCLCITNNNSAFAVQPCRGNTTPGGVIGLTVIQLTSGGTAFGTSNYDSALIKDCAVFGFTTFQSGSGGAAAGSGYNCTDVATAFGSTGNQVSKTFANQFQSTTNDFRVKAGADLINNGTTDSNIDPDISRTTRSGTPTIGCWEYVSAGGSSRPVKMAGYWAGYAGNSGGFAGDD